MRRLLPAIILVSVGIWVSGFMGAWWMSAVVTVGILAILNSGIKRSILTGAVSFGLVWLLAAVYWLRIDDTDLIGRTSTLLGGISSIAFLFITLLVGLITGILSGWLGGVLGQFINNKNIARQNG